MSPGAFDLFRRRAREPRQTPPVVLHARPSQRPQIQDTLESMMAELRQRAPDWQAVVAVRLLDFLINVARLRRGSGQPRSVPLANRVKEAVIEAANYIESHYTEAIRLDTLSKQIHLSPFYLSRNFTRQMGMGVVDYLHHIRLEEACRMLRYTDDSVSRVAGLVGYNEIAYFSRRFRREVGIPPREYRKTYRPRPSVPIRHL